MSGSIISTAETFSAIDTDTQTGVTFDLRGRTNLAIAIQTAEIAGYTDLRVGIQVSWDKDQWYTLQAINDPTSGAWEAILDTDVNVGTSPVSAGLGQVFHVYDLTDNIGVPVPAPSARLTVRATGTSPVSPTDSAVTLSMIAY